MTMLELVKHLNFAVVVLFTLLYLYQGFYVVVGLVRRRWQDRHQPSRLHRFAVIVSARNEEGVIGELLESLNRQNYPKGAAGSLCGGRQLHRRHRGGGPPGRRVRVRALRPGT